MASGGASGCAAGSGGGGSSGVAGGRGGVGSGAVTGGSAMDGAVAAGVPGGGVPAPAPWSRVRDGSYWVQEVWKRGEPSLRPERGRVVLARTAGMAKLEQEFYGRALFVKIDADVRVTPEALVASFEQHCGLRRGAATAEVTSPPYHFFV